MHEFVWNKRNAPVLPPSVLLCPPASHKNCCVVCVIVYPYNCMRNKIAEIGGKSARNRGFKTPHADANSRQDVYYILGNVLHGRLIRSGHLWGSNIFSNHIKVKSIWNFIFKEIETKKGENNHIKVKSILECSRKPHSFLFQGDWNKKNADNVLHLANR